MRTPIKILLLATLLSMNTSNCFAQEITATSEAPSTSVQTSTLSSTKTEGPADLNQTPPKEKEEVPVSATNVTTNKPRQAPVLVAPVVENPKKRILKPANRKVDLHAIIFDPVTVSPPPEDAQEMTQAEIAKYKIHEALHGEVSAASTKGLLEDTMKMTFEKGPIESIAPWIDYSGYWTGAWTGPTYKNSTYTVNFQDVGINGKFRTKDDPASGKKTVFRLMYNTGRAIDGNTYLQSFLADNYIMRYWTKDDQILVGYARAAVGVEGGESPFTIPFFARSQISRTYGNVRTLGAKMQGNHKYYDYSAGIFSSGRFFKDFFPGPEFVGLFSVKPLAFANGKYGNLTIGGSLNAGNADSHYSVEGAHLIYEYKRLKATFEYATADGSNGSTGFTSNQSEGFYGNLAYRITPRIQAVVRYDQFDPNKNVANDIRREYSAGLNYFVKGQALKLMVNYVYYSVENGTYGSRIMAGTQIVL